MNPAIPPARGLSPRGRGKRPSVNAALGLDRSIPAWAGETGIVNEVRRIKQVYPRVGGGNRERRRHICRAAGLSPRGRGKLRQKAQPFRYRRSIPAWAGETIICMIDAPS